MSVPTTSSTPAAQTMPLVPFGPAQVSRLILGANPINGGSHLSGFVNRQMKRYFTEEHVVALLRRCRELGVNAWQSGELNLATWQRFCKTDGPLHFLALAAEKPDDPDQVQRLARAGILGIAHHGEVTDNLFRAGRLDEAREFCKRLRDAGVQVGVSTHMPAVVEAVEEQDWDIDFYMACAYERHRTREALLELLGHVPLPIREVYLESDPPRMYEAIRQTSKTCLVFKILAAGRLCDRPETVEAAFRSTFEGIKPQDAAVVGIYPEYTDQVAEDVALTIRYGS